MAFSGTAGKSGRAELVGEIRAEGFWLGELLDALAAPSLLPQPESSTPAAASDPNVAAIRLRCMPAALPVEILCVVLPIRFSLARKILSSRANLGSCALYLQL